VCPVPVVVSKQYECPGFVGPDSLVFAVSFSGDTEETVAATRDALARGARVVAVTAGGELAALAAASGAALLPVDGGIPMPRAAVGAVSTPLLVALERLGLAEGMGDQLRAAVDQLRRRRDRLATSPVDAVRLARRIGRTLPLVYGGGALGEVAAWRWKTQFNENPKIPAWANRIPELTHNEVAGWAQHGDVTRQVVTMVLLRHDHEHPHVARRFAFVAEVCDEVVGRILTVEAAGEGPLAQLLDLVLVGDAVSLQMAFAEGVDPGPVPVLDDLKAVLRSS
jgi:glucose/mannose-6-phosphate isomerase